MHDDILAATGGEPGILNRGPIESAIARARWGPFPGEGDLAERGALLMRGIVSDHPFVDGNKRTAFEVADTFCVRDGKPLTVAQDEIVEFTVQIAQHQPSVATIAAWLRGRMSE